MFHYKQHVLLKVQSLCPLVWDLLMSARTLERRGPGEAAGVEARPGQLMAKCFELKCNIVSLKRLLPELPEICFL